MTRRTEAIAAAVAAAEETNRSSPLKSSIPPPISHRNGTRKETRSSSKPSTDEITIENGGRRKVSTSNEPSATNGSKKRSEREWLDEGGQGSVAKGELAEDSKATEAKKGKNNTKDKKLASYRALIQASPFPDHHLPTPEEAERVAWLLGEHHGYRRESQGGKGLPRYQSPKEEGEKWGGCGDVASVLDATIRTVLSCNTSGRNSAAAHRSLTQRFGNRNWKAILEAPLEEVVESIRCGGLANNKAKTIQGILRDTQERYGVLSLDHLHNATDDEIMEELVSFNGVGPKVASCVLAFCIGRQSMAVDTHVWRLSRMLNWVPPKATRDQCYYHLHERVPGHLKYALHVLMIKHGKTCANCSAKGFATVKEEDAMTSGDEEETGVKKEGKDEDGETSSLSSPSSPRGSQAKSRPCPLKSKGLLGRTGKGKKQSKGEDKDEKKAIKPEVKGGNLDRGRRIKEEEMPTLPAGEDRVGKGEKSKSKLQLAQEISPSEMMLMLDESIQGDFKERGFTLEIVQPSDLVAEDRKRIFTIFEENMKELYVHSSQGWKPTAKKREFFSDESRFLIVRPKGGGEAGRIAGYIMFRLDTELCHSEDPVLGSRRGGGDDKAEDQEVEVEVAYCYEVQVSKSHQRLGIASRLMKSLETIAERTGMIKVMLTVFDENLGAREFYQSAGFELDMISPTKEGSRGRVDYEILSKSLIRY
ncbi:DNA glycosylase [Violaceomyces palustris]|uniref:DNA glycosylase n=1 Tax=Violaceomyces palustris TaxID=1673888 RepID=A0ACD0NXB0_9BASI|nr:DNA glycosylase [Violaceomyces palustris]